MATHCESMEAAIDVTKDIICINPLSGPPKNQFINDISSTLQEEFELRGFWDAAATLDVTINDPEPNGPDPIVLWLDYEQPSGTPCRCRCPLTPDLPLLIGCDQVW